MENVGNLCILAEARMYRRIRYIAVNVYAAVTAGTKRKGKLNISGIAHRSFRQDTLVILDADYVIPDLFVTRVLQHGYKAMWVLIYTNENEIPAFMPLCLHAVVYRGRLEAELMEILKKHFLRD